MRVSISRPPTTLIITGARDNVASDIARVAARAGERAEAAAAPAYSRMGKLHFEREAWSRAAEFLQKSLRLDSENDQAHFLLGLAPAREKLDRVLHAADKVRERYGFDAVQLARALEPDPKSAPRKKRRFLGRARGLTLGKAASPTSFPN